MDIGKVISVIRREKKITQVSLAKQCGISVTTLSKIERGLTKPNNQIIEIIAEKLGVGLEYVLIMSFEKQDLNQEKKDEFQVLRKLIL